MARVIGSEHIPLPRGRGASEIRPGGAIQHGSASFAIGNMDVPLLWEQIHRNAMDNPNPCRWRGMTRKGIAESSATYATRYRGWIVMPFDQDKIRFHVFGKNCIVRLTVDGAVYGTVTCGATLQVYSGTTQSLTSIGVTSPASGFTVLVEGRDNAGTPGTHYDVWIEHVGEQTSTTDLDSIFNAGGLGVVSLDATAFDADLTWDRWLAQRTMNNARHVAATRTPALSVAHPVDDPHVVSSCVWRADGPYELQVPPWCNSIDIVVTCAKQNIAENVELSVMIEGDEWGTVLARAVTISSTTFQDKLFAGLAIANRAPNSQTPVRFYVCVKSAVGAALYNNQLVGPWFGSGQLELPPDLSSYIPQSHQLVMQTRVFSEVDYNDTPKPSISYGDGFTYKDIAGVEHNADAPVWLTPSIFIEDLPDISPYALVNILRMGALEIYNIDAVARVNPKHTNQLIPGAGGPPRAGLVEATIRLVNNMGKYGGPVYGIRHHGNTWQNDFANNPIVSGNSKVGRWVHCHYGDWQDVLVVPISAVPQPSSPTGLAILNEKFIARASFCAVNDSGVESLNTCALSWRIVLDTMPLDQSHTAYVGPAIATGTAVEQAVRQFRAARHSEYGTRFTIYDVIQSVRRKVARVDGPSGPPDTDYEHDYTMQNAWPREVMQWAPWDVSPPVEIDVNTTASNYPLFLKLQCLPSTTTSVVVVVGAMCWAAPRT